MELVRCTTTVVTANCVDGIIQNAHVLGVRVSIRRSMMNLNSVVPSEHEKKLMAQLRLLLVAADAKLDPAGLSLANELMWEVAK
jgi:hypothetical protein